MDKHAIGKRIRDAREALGISGQQLGARLSPPIQRQSVNQWETGMTFPDLKRVEQLSDVLNISPEWILFGSSRIKEITSDEIDLLNNYRLLSACSKESILTATSVLVLAKTT